MGVRASFSLHRATAVFPLILAVSVVTLLLVSCAPMSALPIAGAAHPATHSLIPGSVSSKVNLEPVATIAGSKALSGAPALSGPSAGSLFRTVYPNYNATTSFNFPGTVWDWLVGTPAYVPTTHDLWIPTRAAPLRGGPVPQIAPVVIYDETLNEFTGVVPSIQNASALYYDAANGDIYSADYSNASVGVINATTEDWVHSAIPVGINPLALAFDPTSSRLFVANSGSSNITGINCSTDIVSNHNISLASGSAPHALSFDEYDHLLFVADGGDHYLRIVDTLSNTTILSTYAFSGPPSDVAYSKLTGNVAITVASSTDFTILNASTLVTVAFEPIGRGLLPLTTNSTGSTFVIGDANGSSLVVVNASTGLPPYSNIPVGENVTSIISSSESENVIAWAAGDRNLSVVNLDSRKPVASSPTLGPEPASISYDSATNRMFVANIFGGRVLILNASTGFAESRPWWFGSPASALSVDESTNVLYVGTASGVDAVNVETGGVLFNTTNTTANTPLLVDPMDGLLWLNNGTSGLTALYLRNLSTAYSVGISWPSKSPLQQDTMALVPPEHELFVVNETSNVVESVDLTTHQIVSSDIPAGPDASAIAYDGSDGFLYVLGKNLTVIDPQTGAMVGLPIPVVTHAIPTGLVYDPSRQDLYVATALGNASEYVGTISVVDGSSLAASYGSQVVMSVGEFPTDPLPVLMPGSVPESTSVIWVADLVSGTLTMITSPPQITFLNTSPSAIDLGQTSQVLLGFEGGTGAEAISYTGLPPGCATSSVVVLNCTPSTTGNFAITAFVNDSFGFSASATAELTVASALSVSVALSPPSVSKIDVGQKISVQAIATGGTPAYTYEWSFGDGATATGVEANHTYGAVGSFSLTVTVTDSLHVSATSSATVIEVSPLPSSTISVHPSNVTDVNLPLAFSAAVRGGTWPGTATWQFGDGNSSTGFTASHAWSHAGVYLVTLDYRDATGAYANVSETITVNPALTATFTAGKAGSSSPPPTGTSVPFTATVTGGTPPYNVTWQFGDGSEGFGTSALHAYAVAGQYEINVTVVDEAGARLTESLPLTIASAPPVSASSSSSSWNNLDLGIFFGFLIGAAVALVALYFVGRSRRRPPQPPSPYVPPETVHRPSWKED